MRALEARLGRCSQPGALPSSPALSSHLVLSHNWLWQPSLLEISRKGECHSHNCHMALLSFSNLERNATTTNIKAIERGVALVLNCSKPHNPTKSLRRTSYTRPPHILHFALVGRMPMKSVCFCGVLYVAVDNLYHIFWRQIK